MKKTFIAAFMLLAAFTVSAQDYTHSIGVNVGSMYGVSYKGFIFGVDGLALQADLGVKLISIAGEATNKPEKGDKSTYSLKDLPVFTFEANPNILYQSNISSWDFGSLDWFAGGGVSIGFMQQFGTGKLKGDDDKWYDYKIKDAENSVGKGKNPIYGKMGVNAIGGLELGFSSVPLALSFDFRPGFGLGWHTEKEKEVEGMTTPKTTTTIPFFDWALNVGLRYCF